MTDSSRTILLKAKVTPEIASAITEAAAESDVTIESVIRRALGLYLVNRSFRASEAAKVEAAVQAKESMVTLPKEAFDPDATLEPLDLW